MSFGWLWYLSVIPALGFLVFVHELGHFLVGLKMGVKIEEFGFGYPPRALTLFHYKGIPITLNWLPLGGFVRFAGEESNFDDPHSLAAAPPRRKIPIMAAGAIMNVLTAILIFACLAPFGTGIERVGRVSINEVTPNSPASSSGLQAEDAIIEINDQPVDSISRLQALIKARQGQETTLTIERDGFLRDITLTPRRPEEIPDGEGAMGIAPMITAEDTVRTQYTDAIRNPLAAVWYGVQHTFDLFRQMLVGIAVLFGSLFGAAEAPKGGLAGPVGITRLTGEIARTGGLWPILNWTALLSVNLALVNLLPFPALDGSRIVFAIIEWVRGKKVPPQREAFVHAAGMMVLIGLMLLITFTDVRNWIGGRSPLGG